MPLQAAEQPTGYREVTIAVRPTTDRRRRVEQLTICQRTAMTGEHHRPLSRLRNCDPDGDWTTSTDLVHVVQVVRFGRLHDDLVVDSNDSWCRACRTFGRLALEP